MFRKFVLGLGACAVAFLAVGCDKAASTVNSSAQNASNVEQMAKRGADAAATAGGDIKKNVEEALPKIEEKIKTLTGEKAKQASDAFTALKKMFDEFKAAPADKTKELLAPLVAKFTELKTMVGL